MLEQWTRWEPIQGLAKKYCIDSIIDDTKGFSILLSEYYDEKKKARVVFENSVDAYRSTNESFRLSILYDLSGKHGNEFYAGWTFFKVTNSLYIQWLFEQSYGTSESLNFIHFSFISDDSILDVVTNYEPRVELINE